MRLIRSSGRALHLHTYQPTMVPYCHFKYHRGLGFAAARGLGVEATLLACSGGAGSVLLVLRPACSCVLILKQPLKNMAEYPGTVVSS